MRFFYYSGNCHDSIAARKEIANKFVDVVRTILEQDFGDSCHNPAHKRSCNAENVKIKCGKVQRGGKRSFTVSFSHFAQILQ